MANAGQGVGAERRRRWGYDEKVRLVEETLLASYHPVFVAVYDPVAIGLVQSMSHPGGNITGLATYAPGDFLAKRVEILREPIPSASKIALLHNPDNPMQRLVLANEASSTARSMGVALPIVEATRADELDTAFAAAAARQADAIIVLGNNLTFQEAPRITALAANHHLPAIYLFSGLARDGLNLRHRFRRSAGGYVDKILKGTKPSDLPVSRRPNSS